MDTSILEAVWSYRQSLAGAEVNKGVPAFYICGKLRKALVPLLLAHSDFCTSLGPHRCKTRGLGWTM